MNEEEEMLLKAHVESGSIVLWVPDTSTAKRVVSVRERVSEPGLCAHFSNGEHVALYNCELSDFVVGKRLTY